ncbi:hypothetical protein C7N43_38845 [Sphingobacteriales bacterium UPWRP_1]|nr:hypothetical protein C7N43_38845 [Sphingobacteriales bacterium UPWRP_1]
MDTLLQSAAVTNIYLLYAPEDEEFARQVIRRWRILTLQGTVKIVSLANIEPGQPYNLLNLYEQQAQVILLLLSPDIDAAKLLEMVSQKRKIFAIYIRWVADDLIGVLQSAKIPIAPAKPINSYTDKEHAITNTERFFWRWLFGKKRRPRKNSKRQKINLLLLKILQTNK